MQRTCIDEIITKSILNFIDISPVAVGNKSNILNSSDLNNKVVGGLKLTGFIILILSKISRPFKFKVIHILLVIEPSKLSVYCW